MVFIKLMPPKKINKVMQLIDKYLTLMTEGQK